jgi:1-acyl-sn-glycerol-3-phosphate acyltransferase
MSNDAPKDRRFWIVRKIFALIYHFIVRIEIVGQDHFHVDGPCIVVANHLSVFDPPLALILFPRRAWGFAAEKYRRHPLFSPILNLIDVIYIKRGEVDRQALRAALKVLRRGDALGVAPEGTRSEIGQLQRGKEGVAYLASRSNATIVPAAITGTENVIANLKRLRRTPVRLVVGEPFKLPPAGGGSARQQLAAYTDLIMCRIAALLPESYRGYYRHRCAPDGTPLPTDT